ncbi:MAG: sulfotransferase [Blastocatellia bacterium]
MDLRTNAAQLDGWVPIQVKWQQSRPLVDWCYVGARRLTEPFFDQTIQLLMSQPFNLLFRHQTPIETLLARRESNPGLQPTGFIFHMSRCGSTLVSQMLAALPRTVVVSEASPIDSVLRAHFRVPDLTDDEQIEWLRSMVSALGQERQGDEKHFFIKLDCWNTLVLPLIHRAFPGVPWIFLYRNPIEVIVSQLNRRGAHMVPGVIEPSLFGLNDYAIFKMQPEEYCARALAKICQSPLLHREGGRLVNYKQLPEAMWNLIPNFFGIKYSDSDIETLNRVARLDAKNPSLHFTNDTDKKNSSATDLMRSMADKWVTPIYERLETRRTVSKDNLVEPPV